MPVGLLLVFVSLILARESHSLLMGEGIAPETQQRIKELAEKDAAVLKVATILSKYQLPEGIVLMLIVYLNKILIRWKSPMRLNACVTPSKKNLHWLNLLSCSPRLCLQQRNKPATITTNHQAIKILHGPANHHHCTHYHQRRIFVFQ